MEVESVTAESSEVKSLESVNSELNAFDELFQSYLEYAFKPILPVDPTNTESTPDYMKVLRLRFILKLNDPLVDIAYIQAQLHELVERNNMAPFYLKLCEEFQWPVNDILLSKMTTNNESELEKLNRLEEDEVNAPNVWKEKMEFYLRIGSLEEAKKLGEEKQGDTTLSTNSRLEATFALFRCAYCNNCDILAMSQAVEKAKYFIDSAEHKADWTGRNKFKAYEGLYGLAIRDYKRAALNLTDCISTFESYELTDFATIIKFTILACMIALPRHEIKAKVVNSGLIMQELNSEQSRHLREYVLALNECRYSDFFKILAVTEIMLKFEPLTHPHYHQYTRDMKLKAYGQMLASYSVVSMKRMAEIFGVTADYIEEDISTFIVAGKLTCRIDRVDDKIINTHAGVVYDRSLGYQTSIKRGDYLLNRIKRLARIIES